MKTSLSNITARFFLGSAFPARLVLLCASLLGASLPCLAWPPAVPSAIVGQITVDGYSSGDSVERPLQGGPAVLTVRVNATSLVVGYDLVLIRLRVFGSNRDYFNECEFTGVSGSSSEIETIYELDEYGSYEIAAEVLDTAGNWVALESFYFWLPEFPEWPEWPEPEPSQLLVFEQLTPEVQNGQTISGSGWAADFMEDTPVSQYEIWLDGNYIALQRPEDWDILEPFILGIDRPDVASAWGRADWLYSGFSFALPISGLSVGQHTVEIRVYDSCGSGTSASLTFNVIP